VESEYPEAILGGARLHPHRGELYKDRFQNARSDGCRDGSCGHAHWTGQRLRTVGMLVRHHRHC